MALKNDLICFPDISYHAFQHSTDAAMISNLEKGKGVTDLITKINNLFDERVFKHNVLPQCVEVGENQYPSLWKQYVRMAEALSIYNDLPRLFVSTSPTVNAFTSVMKDHYIILFSGLIDLLTENELLASCNCS